MTEDGCEGSAVGALVVVCDAAADAEADADADAVAVAGPGRRPTFGLKARPPVFFMKELMVTMRRGRGR